MRPLDDLASASGVHDVHTDGPRVRFSVDKDELSDALALLAQRDVRSIVASPPTLEELFLRHYGANEEAPSTADLAGVR